MTSKKAETKKELQEFDENPYNPEKMGPADIVRLFYTYDVPVIPVISKRGMLLGTLKKEDLISELSDIERVEKLKVDKFIMKLVRKMSFDDLLKYGNIKEFVVINIFGEVQQKWSRLQLFTASESQKKTVNIDEEVGDQKEEQVLEWIIYLILEHIPRALYAVNEKGKTIFYNSHFEDIYDKKFKAEVDPGKIEKLISNAEKNDIYSGEKDKDLYFYNKDIGIYYEKIPLKSKKKNVGFLIFCYVKQEDSKNLMIPGVDIRGLSLSEMVNSIERQLIVNAVKESKDINLTAQSLKINKKSLINKMKRYGIE